MDLAPPAYVTGIGEYFPSRATSSSSMPSFIPSTSTPCTRNSSHWDASDAIVAASTLRSVHFCHLSVTT